MNVNELWRVLPLPGEYDSMDACDQQRWRNVIEEAFWAGIGEGFLKRETEQQTEQPPVEAKPDLMNLIRRFCK